MIRTGIRGDGMKDIAVNSEGDIRLCTVTGNELLAQKVRLILGTNKGEWEDDPEQGIDFHVILRKNPDYDDILSTVLDGLHQVDESFQITAHEFVRTGRHLKMTFTAVTNGNEEITIEQELI